MCGRYALFTTPEALTRRFGVRNLLNIPPRYNCGPMQALPVVVKSRMGFARWGLLPEWKDGDDPSFAAKTINARSETVAEKPTYRESWVRARRCIVPADGFFEWQKTACGGKQPYYIERADGEMLGMAGLWSKCGDLLTFTILTRPAVEGIKHLHARMPVVIEPGAEHDWFSAGIPEAQVICDAATPAMRFRPVDPKVGKIAHDDGSVLAEYAPPVVKVPAKTGSLF